MNLVFATNNSHKLEEIAALCPRYVQLMKLSDIGCCEDIPETGNTLHENASQKAQYVFNRYGIDCFADDTGLEIEVLNGAPGVISARYAGESRDAKLNMEKVLSELRGISNRNAQFRTVISLIIGGEEYYFEGIVKGLIALNPEGINGFGYDPVFIPEGFDKTFAQLDMETKNKISHRGLAVEKLINFLNQRSWNLQS